MRKIGLLFGSFNPPHNGHVMLGEEIKKKVDEVWYVPASQNPIKEEKPVNIDLRIEMLRAFGLEVCSIEKEMGEGPHYTYDVLIELRKRYPDCQFFVACGEDVRPETWRNGQNLIKEFGIIRLPRVPGLSSTEFRDTIRSGAPLSCFCSPEVEKIIRRENLYSL